MIGSVSGSWSDKGGLPQPALSLLIESAPDILVLLQPDGRCRHVSPASQTLLGFAPETLCGTELQDLVFDEDRPAVGDLLDQLRNGSASASVSMRVRRRDGGWVWMEGNARRVPAGAGAVLALRDITARKLGEAVLEEANSLLRRRVTEDPGTGLAHRGHFLASLERELRRARRESATLTLIVAQMDGFDLFVDLYGHCAADETIRGVASCAERVAHRPGDLAGRLSGGGIGILLPSTPVGGGVEIGRRLSGAVSALGIDHAGAPSGTVTVTIGMACSESDSHASGLVDLAERSARDGSERAAIEG